MKGWLPLAQEPANFAKLKRKARGLEVTYLQEQYPLFTQSETSFFNFLMRTETTFRRATVKQVFSLRKLAFN